MNVVLNQKYYSFKKKKESYTPELRKCIEETVTNILRNNSSPQKPGMLLGKVQSGKTFAYCGIMALAADNSFNGFIILTKGTKFLLKQTLKRLKNEFNEFVQNDEMEVLDIMNVNKLSGYQRHKKLIFCVKKEDDNLNKLIRVFKQYPELCKQKVLIIDDEADFCGVSFKRKNNVKQVGTIMQQISDMRKMIIDSHYLLVTATPFSLYLQPDNYIGTEKLLAPTRPIFTQLVPTHDKYIGGDHFFNPMGEEKTSIYHDIKEFIDPNELTILKNPNSIELRKDSKTMYKYKFWDALLNFMIGGCIRRIQEKKPKKYSFIIHTEIPKKKHTWQSKIAESCFENFEYLLKHETENFKVIIRQYYLHLSYTLKKIINNTLPTFEEVFKEFKENIINNYYSVETVNSDSQTDDLMDERTGQLKLSSPFMVFVGGNILDRGISIENLIGFYYGRSPKKSQIDTVLQHLRCFGPRPEKDMAVTRTYSTIMIYRQLSAMHEIEDALWESIEKNGTSCPVNFIQNRMENVIPCSPNKLLFSDVLSIRPGRLILPKGFQTKNKLTQEKITKAIDGKLFEFQDTVNNIEKINHIEANHIIDLIWKSFVFKKKYKMNVDEFKSITSHLLNECNSNKLNLIIKRNRNIGRLKIGNKIEDAPASAKGQNSELKIARKYGENNPTLILLRQNGKIENKWNGSPFWWPVLVAPKNIHTTLFSRNQIC